MIGGSWVSNALTDLGLFRSDISYETIIDHLRDFAFSSINLPNMLALLGALFFVATLLARTIVPLRISAIISDIFFIAYGLLAHSVNTIILYLLLLPINVIRLRQMLKLINKARASAQGDLSMDWLKPFMTRRKYEQGDTLFLKGEPANEMFFTVTGKFLVAEIDIEVPAGRILGELGFLSPSNRRTQTVKCLEDGEVLAITYDKLLEVYFQNPEFGYYFLRLSSERLLQNNERLQSAIEEYKAKLEALTADSKKVSAASGDPEPSGDHRSQGPNGKDATETKPAAQL
jgi:Cyclic nucleotide-binding domain